MLDWLDKVCALHEPYLFYLKDTKIHTFMQKQTKQYTKLAKFLMILL